MKLSISIGRELRVAGMAALAMGLALSSAYSVAPPPPDGPPAPIMTGIAVSGPAEVDAGAEAQFACTASYSDGTSGELSAVWNVDSAYAAINASGLLAAGNVSADQTATVTATYGGFTATQDITINHIAPVLASVSISGPAIVNEETSAQFSCTASYSDGSTASVAASWSENSSYATISGSGLLSAGNVSADQAVTVTASFGGKTAAKSITVKYIAPSLSGIAVSGPAVVNEGTAAQYTCTASYSDGTSATVYPAWSENSAFATISGSGVMSAGDVSSDQNITITANYGGRSDTHSVTLRYVPPTLEGIAVSGPTRVDEESSAQYVCTATYSDGTSAVVVPSWSQNSGYASIDASGSLVTASVTVDQNLTITANYGGKVDAHGVTLANVVKLVGISISGPASVSENAEARFVCMANYDDGSSVAVSAVWSEDSAVASINAGLLAVGNVEADDSVTVTATFGGRVASRSVAIWAKGSQVSYSLSGFGTIKARLWDETGQAWRELGEDINPDELVITDMESGKWYWLSIEEYDTASGVWEQVHTNWISM